MSCKNPEISDQILAWVDGALSPEEERRFAAHVGSCDACKADADALRSLTAYVQRAYGVQRRAPVLAACPTADELADYAATTAPPNRAMAIEAHLATCPRCNEDVEIMREIDAAPADTERAAPPPLPASLRDAFRAASALDVTGGSSRPLAPVVAISRGGGGGWGMRRVLAAVATLTVLIGMTSLFVMRPDMFGAHQPGSDVVSQPTRQVTAPAAPAPTTAASGSGAESYPPAASASDLKSSKVASANERAAKGDGQSPIADEAPAVRPSSAPTDVGAAGGKSKALEPASAARPARPNAVPAAAPTPRLADSTASTPAPALPQVPSSAAPAAKPATVPVSPAKTAVMAAPRPALPASNPVPSPPLVHAPPAQPPAPVMSKKGEGQGSAMTPPAPPQETRAAPVFAKVAPKVGADKASAAEKDATPMWPTESKAAPRSESKAAPRNNGVEADPDARPARPSGAIARTSTSNVAVSQRTQTEAARRDGERDRYTQSADDTLRGAADQPGAGAAPAPAAAQTMTTPTLSSGSAGPRGYGGNAPAAAPQGGLRGSASGATYASQVAYRIRQTISQMLGTHDFTVRVTVDPAEASGAGQVRRIRVDIVLRGGSSVTAASIRRDVVHAVPLDLQRGDEVVVTHE